jgi:hypothetical protein
MENVETHATTENIISLTIKLQSGEEVIRIMTESFDGEKGERSFEGSQTHVWEIRSLARGSWSHDTPHSELSVERRGRKSCVRWRRFERYGTQAMAVSILPLLVE